MEVLPGINVSQNITSFVSMFNTRSCRLQLAEPKRRRLSAPDSDRDVSKPGIHGYIIYWSFYSDSYTRG